MKYLIINADDFGKFKAVNEGIIEGISKNVITSTSLMVYGNFTSDIRSVKDLPNVSIGLHFDPSNSMPEQYKIEFLKQIDEFIKIVGRKPDHIDSHKIRLHQMKEIVSDIQKYSTENQTPLRDMGFANFIDSFFGLSRSDYKTVDQNLISPLALIKILNNELKEGFNEFMCHAGRVDHSVIKNSSYSGAREIELNSLLSQEFSSYLKSHPGVKLKCWKDVTVI